MDDGDVAEALDAVVAAMDAAMVVVTATVGDERDGCLVGFHSQAGIDPRRYVVWLSVENRTYRVAQRATHLGVHLLSAHDHDLAAHFGGVTADELPDKLDAVAWTPGRGGAPLLDTVPNRFVGRVVEWLRPADTDHHAVVLEPVEVHAAPLDPLRLHATRDISPGHPA